MDVQPGRQWSTQPPTCFYPMLWCRKLCVNDGAYTSWRSTFYQLILVTFLCHCIALAVAYIKKSKIYCVTAIRCKWQEDSITKINEKECWSLKKPPYFSNFLHISLYLNDSFLLQKENRKKSERVCIKKRKWIKRKENLNHRTMSVWKLL